MLLIPSTFDCRHIKYASSMAMMASVLLVHVVNPDPSYTWHAFELLGSVTLLSVVQIWICVNNNNNNIIT